MSIPRSFKRPVPVAAACLSVLLFAGCATERKSSTTSPNLTVPTARSAATVQPTNVEIIGFKFSPDVHTVSPGTTVSWVNSDPYFHSVTSGKTDGPVNEPDGKFDEDLKEQGEIINITFDEPGTYSYYCKQHNAMNGEIRVS